ncbi:hypothetical protein H4R35_003783, partial [Dimargaris xerosporica]
ESPVAPLSGSPLAGPQFTVPSPSLNPQHRDPSTKPHTTPPTRGSQLRPSDLSAMSDGGSPSSMDSVSVRMDDLSSPEVTRLRLPRWFRPWMRRVGLHVVLNRWAEFRRNLFVSQVDYTLHDEETIQMYRGVRPRAVSLQAALSREHSERKVSEEVARVPDTYSHLRVPREIRTLARRNLCRSYSDSAPGSARPSLALGHGVTLPCSPTIAPLGTQTPLLGTHSPRPSLVKPEPLTRTESVMSVSESERSQYQYLGTNLRHRQDLSTPVESYFHPRLLKPITRRLWLPANPLRRLYHDLENECIELDHAIVTAPLLATNPHAGRLRSTWAMEDQQGAHSGSKKSLLAHIPYLRTTYHVLNQTAKDLTANLRPLHSGGSGDKTSNGSTHEGRPARRVLEEQDHSGFMGYLYHQRHRRRSSRKRNLTGDNLVSPTGLFHALRASFTTSDRKTRSDGTQSLGSGASISDQCCTISMITEGSKSKARDCAAAGLLPPDSSGDIVQLSATLPGCDLDVLTTAELDQRSLATAITDADHSQATVQSGLGTSTTTMVRPRLRRHSSEISPRLPEPTLVSERTHSWCMASTLPTRRRASSEIYPLALSGTTRSVGRRLPIASVHNPECRYELPHDSPIVLGSDTYDPYCPSPTHEPPSHPCPQPAMRRDTSHDTSHQSHSFLSNDTDSDAYSSDQGEGRAEIRDLYNEEL